MFQKFASGIASKIEIRLFKTNSIPTVGCRSSWCRNYAAEDHPRFIDGTEYKSVLVRALRNEARKASDAGANLTDIAQGIRMAAAAVVRYLNSRGRKISTFEEFAQIATAAANDDREIGEMVAKVVEKGWEKDLVIFSDRRISHNQLLLYKGMMLNLGYTNKETKEYVLQNAFILIHEKKVSNHEIMFHLMRYLASVRSPAVKNRQFPALIVAEDFEYEILATLALHGICFGTKLYAIKTLGLGDSRKTSLQDLANLTSSKVMTEEFDVKSENLFPDFLGRAQKVVISKNYTIILARPAYMDINGEEIPEQLRFSTENLQAFPAKQSDLVAVLKVAGTKKAIVREKKDRITNALNAAKAAKEGVVPGGGIALSYASKELDKLHTTNSSQKIGVQTLQKALKMVVYEMASRAGVGGSVVVCELLEQDNPNLGYDVAKGEYVDKILSVINEPLKVVRTAFVEAIREFFSGYPPR